MNNIPKIPLAFRRFIVDPFPILSIIIFCCTIIFVSFKISFGAPVLDFFHEGEYLGVSQAVNYPVTTQFPILVHGLLDYIPYDLSASLCGYDSAISCTRAVNCSITAIAMILYLLCAAMVAKTRIDLRISVFLIIIGLFIIINGNSNGYTPLHQGSPSIRDILLIVNLILLFLISSKIDRISAKFYAFLAGINSALGIYWCYDRGIIGVVVLAIYLSSWLVLRRRLDLVFFALLGFAAALIFLYGINEKSFIGHIQNIAYWLQAPPPSQEGRLSLGENHIFRGVQLIVTANVALSIFAVLILWRNRRMSTISDIEMGITIIIISLIFARIALSRPDSSHAGFALPFAIMLIHYIYRIAHLNKTASPMSNSSGFVLVLGVVSICGVTGWFWASVGTVRDNMKMVMGDVPKNDTLAFSTHLKIAHLIRSEGQKCLFTMDNNGVLYTLSSLPPCSRFPYLSYARADYQDKIIEDLRKSKPSIIIWKSGEDQFLVDGRKDIDRLPILKAWLEKNYQYVYRTEGSEIGSNRPLSHIALR